jgi:hypothetical protein
MSPKSTLVIAGALSFGLVLSAPALAQLYQAPTVSNLQNLYQPQTINSYTTNLATQRLNSAYGATRSPMLNPNMQSSFSGARIGLGAGTSTRGSKPFSGLSSSPTVSPYLNLFRTDLNTGSNFNYSTLVEPQLQQQQMNQQLQRATLQNNRRIQSIAAQADFNPQGSKDEYPTGHQTVFGYYGHYYQQPQARQKQQRR